MTDEPKAPRDLPANDPPFRIEGNTFNTDSLCAFEAAMDDAMEHRARNPHLRREMVNTAAQSADMATIVDEDAGETLGAMRLAVGVAIMGLVCFAALVYIVAWAIL